ncbi:MAG: OB-fold nucleic acid binding domain-containing protein, partial [Polyangiaceae bacterium]|nr:OB-fold nucleic acid binding domain-containing protein [Polyangiaceae bacterium]
SVDENKAREIFELVAQFAKYGFNRSHSAGYALVTYQSAYLKSHYPAEFMCALMTADKGKTEKVVRIIDEGRAMGLEILPPDINESDTDFTVVYGTTNSSTTKRRGRLKDPLKPKIRFGLGAIHGVGDAALESMFEARQDGSFKDLFDFCSRIGSRKINKGVLEALVQCGAFDSSHAPSKVSRAQAFEAIERALERGKSVSKDRECGQVSLFGLFDAAVGSTSLSVSDYKSVPPWDLREVCVREKQALGFYLTGHPLDRYGKGFERLGIVPVTALPSRDAWTEVRVAGTVEGYREKIFKGSGGKSVFFDLEDKTGKVSVRARENQMEKAGPAINSGEPIVVTGKLRFPEHAQESDDDDAGPALPTMWLDSAVLLSDVVTKETRRITLHLDSSFTTVQMIKDLKTVIKQAPGPCSVGIALHTELGTVHLLLPSTLTVAPSDKFFTSLEQHFGRQVASLG